MSSVKDAPTSHTSSRTYPIDRFDEVAHTSRVGAHRISSRSRTGTFFLLVGAIITVLLVIAGAIWVNTVGGDGSSGIATTDDPPAVETAEAVLDPLAQVAVLNGTQMPSLQNSVGNLIAENGWGQLAFADYAATNEVEISAVFYQDPALEPAARGLALQLGGVSTYQTDEYVNYGVSFVVLLGSDYAGPGLSETPPVEETEQPPAEAAPEAGLEEETIQ